MKKIAVFASGTGSNFKAIHSNIQKGRIPAEIVLLVSNNPNCGAVKFALKTQTDTLIINKTRYPNPDILDHLLFTELQNREVDLICLAGYMKMVPNKIIKKFERRILNIHPALLPEFGGKGYYGKNVHKAVIESGVDFSGATVHFVDEEYDHGPIVAQKKVPINKDDTDETLADKVLKVEHQLYPDVIEAYCKNKVVWDNELPKIMEHNEN